MKKEKEVKKGDTIVIKENKKGNLFSKAKKAAPKTETKNDKETVVIKDKDFYETLERYEEIGKEEKTLNAEKSGLYGEIKETGIEKMIKMYDRIKRFPGSFNIEAQDGNKSAKFLFITADSYKMIDEERAEELIKSYGEDIVEEETVYSMDANLVEKHGEHLSKLIRSSDVLSEEEKETLIKASTIVRVASKTIEKLHNIKGKTKDIIEDINPMFQVKGVKTKKTK